MVSIGPDFLKPGYGSSLVPLYILTIGITVLSGLRSYYVYQVILWKILYKISEKS
jgi:hypothetical protein